MDFHERMAIQHTEHVFWNPTSDEAIAEVIDALSVEPGMHVLDIACGPGELLIRLAEMHGTSGVGVDDWKGALARARAVAVVVAEIASIVP